MPTAPLPAGRTAWLGLAVLALPTLLVSMDVTVLYLAVPAITADLGPSPAETLWITDAYGFLLAGLLIPMGALGDRIGRRRLLLAGAAGFAVASVLAAVASSPEHLIAARALMGVAGATLMPSTLSLIHHMFTDPGERARAIGVWVTALSVGAVLGPIAGGLVLERFEWGAVFLLALPVMGALLLLGPRLLPEYRDPAPGRVDPASVVLGIAAVLAFVYGVKRLAEHGADGVALLGLVAGSALGTAFLRRQGAVRDPMVDLALFRRASFSTALAANALTLFVVLGTYLALTQHLQVGHGLEPLAAGLWLLPYAAGVTAGGVVAMPLAARLGAARVIPLGLLVAVAGLLLLAAAEADGELAVPVAGSVLLALGIAPVVALSTDLVVGAAPPERAGAAAALSETGSELGGALGIALLGSLAAAVARAEGTGAGGAEALGDGLAVTALVGAAVLLATAAAVARVMRPRAVACATC